MLNMAWCSLLSAILSSLLRDSTSPLASFGPGISTGVCENIVKRRAAVMKPLSFTHPEAPRHIHAQDYKTLLLQGTSDAENGTLAG